MFGKKKSRLFSKKNGKLFGKKKSKLFGKKKSKLSVLWENVRKLFSDLFGPCCPKKQKVKKNDQKKNDDVKNDQKDNDDVKNDDVRSKVSAELTLTDIKSRFDTLKSKLIELRELQQQNKKPSPLVKEAVIRHSMRKELDTYNNHKYGSGITLM